MRWFALLPIVLAATACAAPGTERRRTALQSAEAVLAIDFSPKAASQRANCWSRLPRAFAGELARAGEIAPHPMLVPKPARISNLHSRVGAMAGGEMARRPHLQFLLPTAAEFGQDLADGLVDVGTAVGGSGRMMPEIDDRRHRTDPHDDHPEATFGQRLARRLWL